MAQNYDNINIGDLISADYIKNSGEINSKSLEIMYKTKLRTDLNPQSEGVKNDGIDDSSQVFEVEAKNE